MSSELLKRMAAGEAFDLVEGVREIARVLVFTSDSAATLLSDAKVGQPLDDAALDRPGVDEVAKMKITTPRKGPPKVAE